jgi:hypothetical protein
MNGLNFPRFWAKASQGAFSCWRWSNTSLEEARQQATLAAQRLAEMFRRGDLARGYGYQLTDRPMREEVLREFRAPSGDLAAAVTRNSYGCQVLNTAGFMFVDVDHPAKPATLGGFLAKLFGKGDGASAASSAQEQLLARAQVWCDQQPGWGWRVYRTAAGTRLAATHVQVAANDPIAETAFDWLGSDPLYRRLCRVQRCYRARLTPKPWRCKHPRPPARWPWPDAVAEARFRDWDRRYATAAEAHATCELIATIGNAMVAPDLAGLLQFHDAVTRVGSGRPLA